MLHAVALDVDPGDLWCPYMSNRKSVNIDLSDHDLTALQRIARLCEKKHSPMARDLIVPMIRRLAELQDAELIAEVRRWSAGNSLALPGAERDENNLRADLSIIAEKVDRLVTMVSQLKPNTGSPTSAVSAAQRSDTPPARTPGGAPAVGRVGPAEGNPKREAQEQAAARPVNPNAAAKPAPSKNQTRDNSHVPATKKSGRPPRFGASLRRLAFWER